jgi:hypothetical protein
MTNKLFQCHKTATCDKQEHCPYRKPHTHGPHNEPCILLCWLGKGAEKVRCEEIKVDK